MKPFFSLLFQLNQFTSPIWQIPVSSQNTLKCLPSPKVPPDLALFTPVLSFCLSLSSCLITSFISFFHSFSAAKIFCTLIPLHAYCALKPVVDLSLSLPLFPSNVPQLHTSSMSSHIHVFWNWALSTLLRLCSCSAGRHRQPGFLCLVLVTVALKTLKQSLQCRLVTQINGLYVVCLWYYSFPCSVKASTHVLERDTNTPCFLCRQIFGCKVYKGLLPSQSVLAESSVHSNRCMFY